MDIKEVTYLAESLIAEHLSHTDYRLVISNAVNYLGKCSYGVESKIILSKRWTDVLPHSEILDTILHEIAHAKAFERGCYDHGYIWRSIARDLGAKPEDKFNTGLPLHMIMSPKYLLIDTTRNNSIVKRYYKAPEYFVRYHTNEMYIKNRKSETLGKLKLIPYSQNLMEL